MIARPLTLAAAALALIGAGPAPDRWRFGKDGGAFYGPPESDDGFNLNCHAAQGLMTFVSWGATRDAGATVRLSTGGRSQVPIAVTYENDANAMDSGTVNIPLDLPVLKDIAAGISPLRAKWSGGAVDTLPVTARLASYVAACRKSARAG